MNTLEDERKFIENLIIKSGLSLREVSIGIGRKESYLHQYIKYGSPRKLSEEDKERIVMIIKKNGKFIVDGYLNRDFKQFDKSSRSDFISCFDFGFDNISDEPFLSCSPKLEKKYSQPVIGDVYESYGAKSSKKIGQNLNICKQEVGAKDEKVGYFSINCEIMGFSDYRVYSGLLVNSCPLEPEVALGDLVILDYTVCKYNGDGIYVCTEDNLRVIKRVVKNEDGSLLLKDNNSEITVDADYGFYGRMISVMKSYFQEE